jgi:Fungal Zn(2)-Cys(6) binuclear cluster domain
MAARMPRSPHLIHHILLHDLATMTDTRPAVSTRACLTCRQQKRKCTKEIPECSLCRKNKRHCDYETGYPVNDSQVLSGLSTSSSSTLPFPGDSFSSLSGVTAPVPTPAGLPPLFFLDSMYFQQARNLPWAIPRLNPPPELLGHFRGQSQVQFNVDVYFTSVHSFFPIGKVTFERSRVTCLQICYH